MKALGDKAMSSVSDRVGGLTDKLGDIAGGGPIGKAVAQGGEAAAEGKSPVGGALKGAVSSVKDKITGGGGGGGKGGSKPTKAINIIEEIDVGVPIRVAYNQWTQYDDWSTMMKKVENAEQDKEEPKVKFKGQIFLSHREWEATITDQVPDERIVWKSQGQKGHVDGAVTFHELGPNLTRILIVLEYYPQGLFEWTGNRWRAQGRRARLEFKNFRRHVMTRTILDPDAVEGWRGTIEDGEIVVSHEDALEQEQNEDEEGYEDEEYDGEEEDGSDEPEDEYDEESEDDEGEEPEESDEAEDDGEADEEEDDGEADAPPRRRRAS
jgi:uncharacterized membrane protein